jgi:hypothetical protein
VAATHRTADQSIIGDLNDYWYRLRYADVELWVYGGLLEPVELPASVEETVVHGGREIVDSGAEPLAMYIMGLDDLVRGPTSDEPAIIDSLRRDYLYFYGDKELTPKALRVVDPLGRSYNRPLSSEPLDDGPHSAIYLPEEPGDSIVYEVPFYALPVFGGGVWELYRGMPESDPVPLNLEMNWLTSTNRAWFSPFLRGLDPVHPSGRYVYLYYTGDRSGTYLAVMYGESAGEDVPDADPEFNVFLDPYFAFEFDYQAGEIWRGAIHLGQEIPPGRYFVTAYGPSEMSWFVAAFINTFEIE